MTDTPASSGPPASRPSGTTLDAEIQALGEVRVALGKTDAGGALERLDAYGRAFPQAVLADEAAVLRVDALVLRGDQTAAAALARRFLASNPSSPHASHLRSIASRGAHSVIDWLTLRNTYATEE